MRLKWKLVVASTKMLFRQKEAVIWTFLLPLLMIFLFALVDFGGVGRLELGVVNNSGQNASSLISALKEVRTLDVTEGSSSNELEALQKGERDLVLVIDHPDQSGSGVLTAYVNDAKPQEAQLGSLLIQRVLDENALSRTPVEGRTVLRTATLKGRNLTYIDFLIPGIVSMSIMQMGIFGVAFSFVALKKRGILRRLSVTPVSPNDFVVAQIITRLAVVMLQICLMVGIGMLFLHLHFVGNIVSIFVIGILGALVFLGVGFTIAGVSRSEDQVAPLANIVAMPMILLSGVFFSRANLPGIIHVITGFFPLTYFTDSMRAVAIDGASLLDVGWNLVGLVLWGIVTSLLAIRFFRWE